MSHAAITVDNIGKCYRIGMRAERYPTFRDALTRAVKAPLRRLRSLRGRGTEDDEFWALRGVSFEVQPGEVVGIIGRNGAGKSTLLKVLSRITEPTEGVARLRGRVASLLEVGTGFHPELTGRENVYLNGSILGMRKVEIDRKFDEIVAFSEIEKFLDTPVKRYSSGMYVRLAFAVAAHLEPEILIVDEVLAVGDAAFQQKCLGKMRDVAQGSGRTVIFVSHNMAAVQTLCSRGILLRQGCMSSNSSVDQTIAAYLGGLERERDDDVRSITERRGRGRVRLAELRISTHGTRTRTVPCGYPVCFEFVTEGDDIIADVLFTIYDNQGQPLVSFSSQNHAPDDRRGLMPSRVLSCELNEMILVPGRYRLNVAISADGELQDHIEGVTSFDVIPGPVRGRPVSSNNAYAKVALPHRWSC